MKRIFRVSWKSVVYRIASRSSDAERVWSQFYATYKKQTGKRLRGIEEPDALGPDAFSRGGSDAAPVARISDEPEHLSPSDFVEDRLVRLVRKAVETEAISLGRGAEILDIDLKTMQALAASWLE